MALNLSVVASLYNHAQRISAGLTPEKISSLTHLKYPFVTIIFIILIVLMIILIRHTFITFKNAEEKKKHVKSKRWLRYIVILTRTIILICLFFAIATPFTLQDKIVEGDMSIVIMADNSTSFELFDRNLAGNLKKNLELSFPAYLKYIASGDRSAIADGILSNLKGNDNILLVTDGNNNYGKSLRDVALFVANMNATINAVYLDPMKDDTNIVIKGPDKAIRGTELTYAAKVTQVGKDTPYHVTVKMGNEVMVDEESSGTQTFTFGRKLGEGYHKLTGEVTLLAGDDYFTDNNIYYKTIEILPRPKIFLWSKKESYFYSYMMELFNFAREKELPDNLDEYAAVMMNDINLNEITPQSYERLVDFVLNGSGLVVYGGQNSYDKGGYQNSLFETILPVKTTGTEPEQAQKEKINVVVLIDVSDSTGNFFSQEGGDTKVNVEKSMAISILDFIKKDSKLGVVAFNTVGYTVWPLEELTNRYDIEDKVSRLNKGGGTDIAEGINYASDMFNGVKGSNNIILISDGVTISPPAALAAAEMAKRKGVTVYTVGVGRDSSEITLKNIAVSGGGHYYRPTQSQRLKIIFGEPEEDEECNENRKKIVVLDPNHFITENLEPEAILTGHNFVAPKPTASVLVSTCDGKPIMTVWRYGLGRVVSMATDDGSYWSGDLLNAKSSEMTTRMINWAVGDPTKTKDFDVDAADGNLGEPIKITVKSKEQPKSDIVQFTQTDPLHYEGYFTPTSTGFFDFFGAVVAVNYKKELEKTGFNSELIGLVKATGGEMFDSEDLKSMINKTKSLSRRTETQETEMRWPFLLIALIVFLIEIAIRRLFEMW